MVFLYHEIFYLLLFQFTVVTIGLTFPILKIIERFDLARFTFTFYVICTWINGVSGFMYAAATVYNNFNWKKTSIYFGCKMFTSSNYYGVHLCYFVIFSALSSISTKEVK